MAEAKQEAGDQQEAPGRCLEDVDVGHHVLRCLLVPIECQVLRDERGHVRHHPMAEVNDRLPLWGDCQPQAVETSM